MYSKPQDKKANSETMSSPNNVFEEYVYSAKKQADKFKKLIPLNGFYLFRFLLSPIITVITIFFINLACITVMDASGSRFILVIVALIVLALCFLIQLILTIGSTIVRYTLQNKLNEITPPSAYVLSRIFKAVVMLLLGCAVLVGLMFSPSVVSPVICFTSVVVYILIRSFQTYSIWRSMRKEKADGIQLSPAQRKAALLAMLFQITKVVVVCLVLVGMIIAITQPNGLNYFRLSDEVKQEIYRSCEQIRKRIGN
ncbi:hypothetical protein NEHOM01_0129 [Nematocida homosporus]|uniref:uncharacterized protein n=1 Tax=Nematocida homosporus TaxID=1912981 RepID=UPI00221E779A|nr:uncharacterized protein NEHOM01_0129 [Nematocida homosporus]KAI5184384.1 hypothetical protein NEHOM01_0129 [Nematocida homosporus]